MSNDIPKWKPILCIDFDGVIHSYTSGWKGPRCIPDPPVEGAFEFLVSAIEHFQVCIYSSRSRYLLGRWAMKQWMKRWMIAGVEERMKMPNCGLTKEYTSSKLFRWYTENWHMEPHPHDIIDAWRALVKRIKFPTRKPAAFLQIDDRAVTFHGVFQEPEDLLKFKPWNKK